MLAQKSHKSVACLFSLIRFWCVEKRKNLTRVIITVCVCVGRLGGFGLYSTYKSEAGVSEAIVKIDKHRNIMYKDWYTVDLRELPHLATPFTPYMHV